MASDREVAAAMEGERQMAGREIDNRQKDEAMSGFFFGINCSLQRFFLKFSLPGHQGILRNNAFWN